MSKALTDSHIKSIEPPATGRVELTDLRCSGLCLRVTAKGAKSWAFRFRDPKTGASTRATIGTYPEIGLGAARARADALRATVAAGSNPVTQKRSQRASAQARSFATIAARYLEEHAKRHKRTAAADEMNLRVHILPRWRSWQVEDIKRSDVIALAEEMIRAGTPVAANRVQSLVSKIFSFALDEQLLDANPCARLKKRGAENVGTRVLSDDELRLFWRHAVLPPASRTVGLALRLALLTGTRASEAAEASLAEFHGLDVAGQAVWMIPAARTKNKRAHLMPLSDLALTTVLAARELIGPDAKYLFASRGNDSRPITGHSLGVAMKRIGQNDVLQGAGAETWTADPPTPHDLRRSFATRLSAMRVPKEDRDACLNHAKTDVGSKHYDLYDRIDEKRAAVQMFSESIVRLIS